MAKRGIIYLLYNFKNGKIYIGQTGCTLRHRWSVHKSAARRGRAGVINAAIREDGEDSFVPCELASGEQGKALDEMEAWFIEFHESNNPEFGYNVAEGGLHIYRMFGDRNPNHNLSAEQRAARGQAISAGLRKRREAGLSVGARPGHVYNPFPAGNKLGCFPKSDEHRQKISEARKRYWENRRVQI